MTEFAIRALTPADIPTLAALARKTWLAHYPGIISLEQIDYMLAQRYSPDGILASLPHSRWDGAWADSALLGFSHALPDRDPPGSVDAWKLDKLYVDPAHQRMGIGAALLQAARQHAIDSGARLLRLRVNRHNTAALAAYARYGFRTVREDVLDIGQGFVMDDYVMELPLTVAGAVAQSR